MHHQLNSHEYEKAPGVGEGQGSLACCSPWGRKESDMTLKLNNKNHWLKLKLFLYFFRFYKGFPGSSPSKESTCNAGDPGSIPGLGRYPGDGAGYPLQYSGASLVAQLVKNLPAM